MKYQRLMVTYFFDITMHGSTSVDQIGYNFPTDIDAEHEARKIASELIFDEHIEHNVGQGFMLTITNGFGIRVGGFAIEYDLSIRH